MDTRPIEPLQQGLQLGRTEPHHPVAYRRPAELAVVQALRDENDAGAVPEDQLYPVGPLRAEHVDHAGERIGAHRLAHQRGQPLCSLAEVDRLRRHHNPDVPGWPDHECALSARITASIARGFASAPTRTSTPAISSSIPSALDRRRARRGALAGGGASGPLVSTTAGKIHEPTGASRALRLLPAPFVDCRAPFIRRDYLDPVCVVIHAPEGTDTPVDDQANKAGRFVRRPRSAPHAI